MKRSLILLSLICALSFPVISQEHQGFQASFSVVTRLSPMVIGHYTENNRTFPIMVNITDQLNGPGMNLNIGLLLKKANLQLSIGNTLRYDIVGYYRLFLEPKPDSRAVYMPIWKLIDDFELSATKYFRLKKVEPFVTAGLLLMNQNSSYMIPDTARQNSQGGNAFYYLNGDFGFPALKTGLGLRYDHWFAELNVLWCFQEVYDFDNNLALPEIRIGYAITK